MLELKNVSYSYPSPTGKQEAIKGVSAVIKDGAVTAVVGRTGSGKTTLTEIMAGITVPDSGCVLSDGKRIEECKNKIGTVFQYPEYQLFAQSVREDIAFGPMNMGISGDELDKAVISVAELTGITDELLEKSPFELSGGQKRMTALAGVLAMKPQTLILDEPAAGLDPFSRKKVFSIMRNLADDGMTVVFVTHSMEDAAEFADEILVLSGGKKQLMGTPHEVFSDRRLDEWGLNIPEIAVVGRLLEEFDLGDMLTVDEAYDKITALLEEADKC